MYWLKVFLQPTHVNENLQFLFDERKGTVTLVEEYEGEEDIYFLLLLLLFSSSIILFVFNCENWEQVHYYIANAYFIFCQYVVVK